MSAGAGASRGRRLLAFDSALASCSAAVSVEGRIVARVSRPMATGQAEALVPMILQAMAEAGLAFSALDAVAVTVGPGTFTGVRIGLAAARGVSLAAGVRAVGVTTLEAVRRGAGPLDARVLVALEVKRDELAVQIFDAAGAPETEPALAAPETLARMGGPLVLVGDGAPRAAAALADAGIACRIAQAPPLPDAAVVAALAAELLAAGAPLPEPRPLYLRAPDTTATG